MQSRTLFRELQAGRLGRWLASGFALSVVAVTTGCRGDAESLTAPEVAPSSATTATAALAFWQVSAGIHTCAVATDDRAYCWGSNWGGQLGDGTTVERHTPVLVAGGLAFSQISASLYHTCALTTDNKAYCWGENFGGMLGDGTTGVAPVRWTVDDWGFKPHLRSGAHS